MNQRTSIRVVKPDDALGIASVHVQSWHETYTGLVPQAFLDNLQVERRLAMWQQALASASNCIYVATAQDETIVGFASAGPAREMNDRFDAELYAIYLLKSHQGDGTGRALMQSTAVDLLRRGHRSLFLWVLAENKTRHFYAHLGGTPIADKESEIGGVVLHEVAYAWPDMQTLGHPLPAA
jgi:GNAT superfamily N-acetyltransferase